MQEAGPVSYTHLNTLVVGVDVESPEHSPVPALFAACGQICNKGLEGHILQDFAAADSGFGAALVGDGGVLVGQVGICLLYTSAFFKQVCFARNACLVQSVQ